MGTFLNPDFTGGPKRAELIFWIFVLARDFSRKSRVFLFIFMLFSVFRVHLILSKLNTFSAFVDQAVVLAVVFAMTMPGSAIFQQYSLPGRSLWP